LSSIVNSKDLKDSSSLILELFVADFERFLYFLKHCQDKKANLKSSWYLSLSNICLIFLIVYLAKADAKVSLYYFIKTNTKISLYCSLKSDSDCHLYSLTLAFDSFWIKSSVITKAYKP